MNFRNRVILEEKVRTTLRRLTQNEHGQDHIMAIVDSGLFSIKTSETTNIVAKLISGAIESSVGIPTSRKTPNIRYIIEVDKSVPGRKMKEIKHPREALLNAALDAMERSGLEFRQGNIVGRGIDIYVQRGSQHVMGLELMKAEIERRSEQAAAHRL